MNKTAIFFILLLDVIGIAFVSGLISYGFFLLGKPFIPTFVFTLACIIILGIAYNSYIKNAIQQRNSIIENDTARLLTNVSLNISCAYCRAENIQLLNLNEDMVFTCVSCKQPNKIVFNYGATRTTELLNTQADLGKILPSEELPSNV